MEPDTVDVSLHDMTKLDLDSELATSRKSIGARLMPFVRFAPSHRDVKDLI